MCHFYIFEDDDDDDDVYDDGHWTLSKLRVSRTFMPGRARIRSGDLEAGSHRDPLDNSSASIPAILRAARHTSAAPSSQVRLDKGERPPSSAAMARTPMVITTQADTWKRGASCARPVATRMQQQVIVTHV